MNMGIHRNINYFGSSGLNISFTINGQLVNSVESIVPALGYDASSNAVLLVTSNNDSVDMLFAVSPSRKLTITVQATRQVIYNQTWPACELVRSLSFSCCYFNFN